MLLNIFIVFIGAYCGFKFGQYLTVWSLRQALLREAAYYKQVGNIVDTKETGAIQLVMQLHVDRHGDDLYLYNTLTDEFVVQGESIQELAETAFIRNNIKYAAVVHDDQVLVFVEGKVQST